MHIILYSENIMKQEFYVLRWADLHFLEQNVGRFFARSKSFHR